MKFKIGRSNLAATIYVPYDCKNNCPFCTSKDLYSQLEQSELTEKRVKRALRLLVKDPKIKDIVFTGGEPTANPKMLDEMVAMARHKNVYINTTLPYENFFECLDIFNSGAVKGVNISRHFATYEQDAKMFHNIVGDWAIEGIKVPVKINVVLNENTSISEVRGCIERWKDFENVTVCFRRDYTKITPETLHTLLNDDILNWLIENYEFKSHTFCDVCDTVNFEDGISFHRGLEQSSIKIGNTVMVNDIIVFPDGFVSYDWDRKPITDLDGFTNKNSDSQVYIPDASNPYRDNHIRTEDFGYYCGVTSVCGSWQSQQRECVNSCGIQSSCGIHSSCGIGVGYC